MKVYILRSFDEWFSWSSQVVQGVFSSYENAYNAIKELASDYDIWSNGDDQWFYGTEDETMGGFMITEVSLDEIRDI